MPKISGVNNSIVEIPLDSILLLGNVRTIYAENKIQELAESIRVNGLINPVTVKRTEESDEFGHPKYELICGHRRLMAYRYLCANGQGFNQIPAVVKTGSKVRLQLIENIQRENLQPQETEEALKEMLKDGYSQAQIALELSKPQSWVSDILAGNKVREQAEEAGIDTANISSKTLSQLRSLPPEELPSAVDELNKQGGSYRAATKIKNKKNPNTKKSDGLTNPIAKQIQTAWATFNRLHGNMNNTAFDFYKFLLEKFEGLIQE